MTADLRLSVVDFFPFILAFNHNNFSIVWLHFEMSHKKNNGCQFNIDLGDDEEDIDFGPEDDFDHVQNFSLADFLNRSDQRRAECE